MRAHGSDPTSTARRPRWRHAADAQVMLLFAMAFVGLIGMVALSIDAGYLMAERRQV